MASLQKSTAKLSSEQKVDLLFVLKEQLDLVYKQLNYFRGACKIVDRFNRTVKGLLELKQTQNSSTESGDDQLGPGDRVLAEFVKFERSYRYRRKRLRKLDRKLLKVNVHNKICEFYESLLSEECETIKNNGTISVDVNCTRPPLDVDEDIFITEDCLEVQLDTPDTMNLHSVNLPYASPPPNPTDTTTRVTRNRVSKIPATNSKYGQTATKLSVSRSKPANSSSHKTNSKLATKSKKQTKQQQKQQQQQNKKSKLEELLVCDVDGCNYSTRIICSMKKHQSCHSEERPYKCDRCWRSFKIKGHLKDHQNVHDRKRFECTFEGCTVSYANQNDIRKHIRIVHTKEATVLYCDWEGCEYSTYRTDHLKSHWLVHTRERPYKCNWPGCRQAFNSASNLSKHKTTHRNRPRFRCSWPDCLFNTARKLELKAHLDWHQSPQLHQCAQCEQSFETSAQLSEHRQSSHESQYRYRCSWPDCQYGANRFGNIKRHTKLAHETMESTDTENNDNNNNDKK